MKKRAIELIDRNEILRKIEPWLYSEGRGESEINMLRAVIAELKSLPAAPRWVRCGERLPEKNGAYIVFIGYGDKWIWFKDIFKDGKFMADTCALNSARVTHWMPIEPPKEDA